MKILVDAIRQLTSSAQAVSLLVQDIPLEQALWKPDPESWSIKDVMDHLYNEERLDFRKHLKEIFSDPPLPWGRFNPEEYFPVDSCSQALAGFVNEREDSIAWLNSLESPDWQRVTQASFGPEDKVLTLKAGDVLVSWVAHDYLHIRQLNELLFAWIEEQAAPFSVLYAGGW